MISTFSLVFIVVELLGIASAIHALFTVRTPQGTVAWVVGLVAFPWLGLPLYWFFGSRRFDAHSLAMQEKLYKHRELIDAVRAEMAPFRVEPTGIEPETASPLAAIARQEFLRGNRLELLIDGKATFAAILAEIARAKHSVYVQFYIVRNDGLGRRLLEALAAKAAEGVDCCFLIDSFGGAAITPRVMRHWRARGVRITAFSALSGWRDRWRLNFRNHRKNVIVDGRVGFIGGHNVGDEYLGKNPKYGRWRDTHVRVEGPTALQLQMVFAADWYFTTGEILDAHWQPHDPAPADAGQRSLVLASGPSDQHERCTHFFLHVISMAKHRLWIASPYFVPDEGILQALQLAAIRGVDVRILLPMKPDQYLVWLASFALLKELDHPRIHVHRFTGGFLHHKALVVDEGFAAVGTKNFDNRSFRLNFEITLAVTDARFAAEVAAMFERDFAESREVGPRAYDTLSFHQKVGAKAARLLAPIL
ncbi:cardiolipin synthase [Thiocapsa roseopersicina]|uniref:Cardiolipin synthase n=1 Tax=Thiocapsa roseopersicina TaxID=1058 RepID=A0A1H2ZKV8_THIRO|nr:cardiolipin synthase [Thiocapsa roseopersicina]SDX17997.1 cardiolipin synthase [Thiocapsa roseopersicina]